MDKEFGEKKAASVDGGRRGGFLMEKHVLTYFPSRGSFFVSSN